MAISTIGVEQVARSAVRQGVMLQDSPADLPSNSPKWRQPACRSHLTSPVPKAPLIPLPGGVFLLLGSSGYSVSIDAFCALSERRLY
jgi:hypothetical protein